jgi:hypothetical protein
MADPDVSKGAPVESLTAEWYNQAVAKIKAIADVKGSHPIVVDRKERTVVRIDRTQGFYATLSGSSSPYSFTEKYGSSGGGWSTGVRAGATNAHEANRTSGLNGKTVWLEPGWPGDYRFQYVAAGGGPITGGSLNNCDCPTPPATLTMTLSGTCTNFQSATITWRSAPPSLSAIFGSASVYLSEDTYTDDVGEYYWYLHCFTTLFYLSKAYESSIFGGPLLDTNWFNWTIGLSGNTCDPFLLSNGSSPFSPDDCDITIQE